MRRAACAHACARLFLFGAGFNEHGGGNIALACGQEKFVEIIHLRNEVYDE